MDMKKRAISLLLAAALTASLWVPAFADEPAEDTPEPAASTVPAEPDGEKKEEPGAAGAKKKAGDAAAEIGTDKKVMPMSAPGEDGSELTIEYAEDIREEEQGTISLKKELDEDGANWTVKLQSGYKLEKSDGQNAEKNVSGGETHEIDHKTGIITRTYKVPKEITKVKVSKDGGDSVKSIQITYTDESGLISAASKADYAYTMRNDTFYVAVKDYGVQVKVTTEEADKVEEPTEEKEDKHGYGDYVVYKVVIKDAEVSKVTVTAEKDGKAALFLSSEPVGGDIKGKVEIEQGGFTESGDRVTAKEITEVTLKDDSYMLYPTNECKIKGYTEGEKKYTVELDDSDGDGKINLYIYPAVKPTVKVGESGVGQDSVKVTYEFEDTDEHCIGEDKKTPAGYRIYVRIPTKFEDKEGETEVTRYAMTLGEDAGSNRISGEVYEAPNNKEEEAHKYTVTTSMDDKGKTITLQIDKASVPFTDVPEKEWYYAAVKDAVSKGFINGYTNGTFRPESVATRAEALMMIYRIEKASGKVYDGSVPFSDLKEEWYKQPIYWGFSEDIIKGVTNTQFGPNNTISRAQLVTMLYRLQKEPEVKEELSKEKFTDVAKVPSWAKKAMAWAVEKGIITGRYQTGHEEDVRLDANSAAKRNEICTMLTKYITAVKTD